MKQKQSISQLSRRPILFPAFRSLFFWALSICCSSLFIGFTMEMYDTLKRAQCGYLYNRSSSQRFTSGCVALGALIGAVVFRKFQLVVSRRKWLLIGDGQGILGICFFVLQTAISNLEKREQLIELCTTVGAIQVFGLLIAGAGVGILSSASLIMIAEMAPVKIRGAFGMLYFLLIAVGLLTLRLIEVIGLADKEESDSIISWMMMSFAIGFLVIQALLTLLIYRKQPPGYLITVGKTVQAKQVIQAVYQQNNLVVTEQNIKIQTQIAVVEAQRTRDIYLQQNLRESALFSEDQKSIIDNRTRLLSFLIIATSQSIGIYGYLEGIPMGFRMDRMIQFYLVPSLMLFFGSLGLFHLFLLRNKVQRVKIIQIGVFILTFLNLVIMFGSLVSRRSIFAQIMSLLFIFVYGATIGSVTLLYVMQIMNPRLLSQAVACFWLLQYLFGTVILNFSSRINFQYYNVFYVSAIGFVMGSIFLMLMSFKKLGYVESNGKNGFEIRAQIRQ